MIASKKIKAVNYNLDTYKKKIYIYGIAQNEDERSEVIKEAKEVLDVEDVIAQLLVTEGYVSIESKAKENFNFIPWLLDCKTI